MAVEEHRTSSLARSDQAEERLQMLYQRQVDDLRLQHRASVDSLIAEVGKLKSEMHK